MENKAEHEQVNYTMREAIDEAKRCLNCKKPQCKAACPVDTDIPDFIGQLARGNLGAAREILATKNNLPAVCGRVCPHEKQCEGHCILINQGAPVRIGKLEQFVADFDYSMDLLKEPIMQKTRGNIAVIGSGPAGLTVAGDLARRGFSVTVYEREPEPGGVLLYGIPEFRLPSFVVSREISRISALGVRFINNITIGKDITLDDMFAIDMDAIFIGTGTAVAKDLPLPGAGKNGIIQSNYFLRIMTLFRQDEIGRDEVPVSAGDKVIVIGAGNVAMDAARTAVHMGASSVTVVYRRTINEMPASKSEYTEALEDGVQFMWESTPMEYMGDERITGLKIMHHGGEETIVPADKILLAVGSKPADKIVSTTKGINTNEQGYVITKTKPYGMTTKKGVFAGGDVVHSPATVVMAIKEAKRVANGIEAYVDAIKLLEL